MSNNILHPIGIKDFIHHYQADQTLYDFLPEFSFLKPLSEKYKEKGCFCGLSQDVFSATQMFNTFVPDIPNTLAFKVKSFFNRDQICFTIQKQDGSIEVKCFSE